MIVLQSDVGFALGEASRALLCVDLGSFFVFHCSSLDDLECFC